MFLQLLSGIKVRVVDKTVQSNYLCVILHVKSKKYSFLLFLPDFQFLIKSKMATMFGDVSDPQQRRHS